MEILNTYDVYSRSQKSEPQLAFHMAENEQMVHALNYRRLELEASGIDPDTLEVLMKEAETKYKTRQLPGRVF